MMANNIAKLEALQAKFPTLEQHVSVREYTTMHVGGVADAYFEAKSTEDLLNIIREATVLDFPYRVIGSGSNIIIADEGVPGLLIRNLATKIAFLPDEGKIIVDSGLTVVRMVNECAMRELGGMEYFSGLPGTVGGALYGNAESWGHAVSEFLERATLLLPGSAEVEPRLVSVEPEWFAFRYRSSKLKRLPNSAAKPIILSAQFRLRHKPKTAILAEMKEYRDKRHEVHQPIGSFCSGSFFRNPGDRPSHGSVPNAPEETAGYLIDQAGGKKMKVGEAVVSKEHANFLVNLGQATAHDVRTLATEVKAAVRDQFGVELQEEVEYVGNWTEGDVRAQTG